jgi:hypothetical protein
MMIKVICIKGCCLGIFGKLYQNKVGDIITLKGGEFCISNTRWFNRYFVTLKEWRDKQIDKILE